MSGLVPKTCVKCGAQTNSGVSMGGALTCLNCLGERPQTDHKRRAAIENAGSAPHKGKKGGRR